MTAAVQIHGEKLAVHFRKFDIPNYEIFLKVKSLPEYELVLNDEDETYTVTAPARFAHLLGVEVNSQERDWLPFPLFLYDDQRAITEQALNAKRFAVWSDCGLGKTNVQLEWSRQVSHKTGGRVLMITLNAIVDQTIEEAAKFYGDTLPLTRLESRDEMKAWCIEPGPGIAITNYEKMNPGTSGKSEEVVNEMRYLAGLALDESNRLATGGGKQKWALIKSSKGIPYKLSCTATPAPNDIMEFASQASFLEKMRSEGEIIWTYFTRDPKSHRWTVKPHARKAFFDFMSSWSIYVRDPRRYGWRLGMVEVPKPEIIQHDIPATDEQRRYMAEATAANDGQMSLLDVQHTNTVQRSKLSQIAKGFRYLSTESARRVKRIPSLKPQFVADLIRSEVVDRGLQVLVWTVFDAESDILAELLGDFQHDLLTGSVPDPQRMEMLKRFHHGESKVLISRASMLGFGLNFQCCGSMIFSGWNDSYVSWYQAIRRAVRDGQTKSVRVHVPIIRELEGHMLENIFHKQAEHEHAIEVMEANYIRANRKILGKVA